MEFPSELNYTKEHEWIRIEADGKNATIGITEFAQGELGDVVFVELEQVGTALEKDAVFGTVEAVKTVSELYMPVSGSILEQNDQLESNPELVNDDPYGDGWMIKIELKDPEEVKELLNAEEYAKLVG